MYLHIGGNVVVLMNEIVSILDHSLKESKINQEFLDICNKNKKAISVDDSLETKSYIITKDEIYYSPIATTTLKKRVAKGFTFFEDN